MKSTLRSLPCYLLSIVLTSAASVHAANVFLSYEDEPGTSSFASAKSWSNKALPAATNTYSVDVTLRSPTESGVFTFGGKILIFTSGGVFLTKSNTGVSRFVFNNDGLVLDGGLVRNGNNFPFSPVTLAGKFTVTNKGGTLDCTNEAFDLAGAVILNGQLKFDRQQPQGSDSVSTVSGTVVFNPGGAMFLAYGSGDVAPGLAQSSGSIFTFILGPRNVTYIGGENPGKNAAEFGGTFVFDRSKFRDGSAGDSWKIINTAAVKTTFTSKFAVKDFINNKGVWTSADGAMRFDQATGVLTLLSARR